MRVRAHRVTLDQVTILCHASVSSGYVSKKESGRSTTVRIIDPVFCEICDPHASV